MNHDSSFSGLESNPLVVAPHLGATYSDSIPLSASRQFEKEKKRRGIARTPRGLWNAGQSCHLGAAVTALSAVPKLRTWLERRKAPHSSLYAVFQHYLLEAATSTGSRLGLDPRPLLSVLEKTGWKSRHAQDAHETMSRILDILEGWKLAEEKHDRKECSAAVLWPEAAVTGCRGRTKLVNSNSRKSLLPYSMITSSTNRCYRCGFSSPRSFQTCAMVMLPASNGSQTLSSLFRKAQITEELVEMNCSECGELCPHIHSTDVERYPEVLILVVQRASFIGRTTAVSTTNVPISSALTLPLAGGRISERQTQTYSLRSVIRHWGGASGHRSHFDAAIKQPGGNNCGLACVADVPRWWHVDDDRVRPISEAQACESGHAYLIIYDSPRLDSKQ